MPPNMATAPPAYDGEHKQQKSQAAKSFDATISASLEISSYDLAVLKRQLIAHKWVPASTDEDAIEDAVLRFRRTYRPNRAYQPDYDYENIFRDNKRLMRLFEVWASEEIEESEADRSFDPNEVNEREVERETAKYEAVRALIAHLAARKNYARPLWTTSASLDITNDQAMELLKTNARLRAIFTNNVKKATAKETEVLNQKIAQKDAEIDGMLRSLA
jgi:hypothetical protein